MIIEVDGPQHYEEVIIFKSGGILEEHQERDEFKESIANDNGYSVIGSTDVNK